MAAVFNGPYEIPVVLQILKDPPVPPLFQREEQPALSESLDIDWL